MVDQKKRDRLALRPSSSPGLASSDALSLMEYGSPSSHSRAGLLLSKSQPRRRFSGSSSPPTPSSIEGAFSSYSSIPASYIPHSPQDIRRSTVQISNLIIPSTPASSRRSQSPDLFTPSTPRARQQPPVQSGLTLARPASQVLEVEEDAEEEDIQEERDLETARPSPTTMSPVNERTALLPVSSPSSPSASRKTPFPSLKSKLTAIDFVAIPATAVKALPAVLLGCLLNILDGVSYGMIMFPSSGIFADFGLMGVSMFFITTIVSQLTYTFGGSGFAGANGSMMIEVVPFFHILAQEISDLIIPDPTDFNSIQEKQVAATTLASFSLSAILTGTTFLVLGYGKLGNLIGFFPRHILVGCIGGVGAFLVETGLTVSLRMEEGEYTIGFLIRAMLENGHKFTLWFVPLVLAVALRVGTSIDWVKIFGKKVNNGLGELVFPIYFTLIPLLFYLVVLAAHLDISDLRKDGWVFDLGSGGGGSKEENWWRFYEYLNLGMVQWSAIWATMPTQLALLFFNILHPPLNVPALAVSLDVDVDTNKELVAHGYSNLIGGLVGTVPNYLVYVNTLLFYRVGGDSRIAGFMLALATFGLMAFGLGAIKFIPVMVVGALIFVLGIDLMKEALWDTRHRVSRSEYLTIVSIIVAMTVWDFVIGVLWGIVVSCFFFVLQNSQRRSIRSITTGGTSLSTVRRPSSHRAYITLVSEQTKIVKLQGFLFFGTITDVEERIKEVILQGNLRFLVLDMRGVKGVDMSAAEGLVRVHRALKSSTAPGKGGPNTSGVTMIFCGMEEGVRRELESCGVLGGDGVEVFGSFGDAMEWTENWYLDAWFRSASSAVAANANSGRGVVANSKRRREDEEDAILDLVEGTPRRSHIREVGRKTIGEYSEDTSSDLLQQPFQTLMRAFSSFKPSSPTTEKALTPTFLDPVIRALKRRRLDKGTVLFRSGERPDDGLYFVESGVLKAIYQFHDHSDESLSATIAESMVAGTLAGELSALSGEPRNATVVVSSEEAVVWQMTKSDLEELQSGEESGEVGRVFVGLVLKSAKIDYDILLAALVARQ